MNRTFLAPLLILAACGGSIPKSGIWDYTNEELVENTCGNDDIYDGTSGEFTILDNGDGTFTVDPQDGTDTFVCTLDGKSYTCPERVAEVVDLGFGAKAEISASVKGEFANATETSGTQTATLTCLDSTCESAVALIGIESPCFITVSYDAEWVGADE